MFIKEIFLQISEYLNLQEQIIFSQTNKQYYNLIKNKYKDYRFICYDCWSYDYSISSSYTNIIKYINNKLMDFNDKISIRYINNIFDYNTYVLSRHEVCSKDPMNFYISIYSIYYLEWNKNTIKKLLNNIQINQYLLKKNTAEDIMEYKRSTY
jgi:hypothetical protein